MLPLPLRQCLGGFCGSRESVLSLLWLISDIYSTPRRWLIVTFLRVQHRSIYFLLNVELENVFRDLRKILTFSSFHTLDDVNNAAFSARIPVGRLSRRKHKERYGVFSFFCLPPPSGFCAHMV